MDYETIRVEKRGAVGIVTLDRPQAMNALSDQLTTELSHAVDSLEADDGIRALVVTGSEKVFAAGADIKEMLEKTYMEAFFEDFPPPSWRRVGLCRKPVIAAVAGYALGGGCELALSCDIVVAADNAVFGQPEIKIGTFPGAGGTQRLARYIGKAKTMDLILTGRNMDAEEAERLGVVSRVVPLASLLDEAMAVAETVAQHSLPAVMMAKEAVNRAYETPLAEGLTLERRMFQSTFGTEDQREGMRAFAEKRKPGFKHR